MAPRRQTHPRLATVLVLIALALSIAVPSPTSAATYSIKLSRWASGLAPLTQVTNADDGTGRLFLVERRGTIRVYDRGMRSGNFLDIRSKVEDNGERGLLGLAFHPEFKSNRYLFLFFTRKGGDVVVARYRTNLARTAVIASSYAPLMLIEHSAFSNHNGGGMAFGPDGYLYISVGDGGGSGDPGNDAQEISSTLLGKLLRIDVDGTGEGPFNRYSIPAGNPYVGRSGHDEIWAIGLRNAWRISFDRTTGALFIADVGQRRWEEVNREPAGSTGGRNYGWSVLEGRQCYGASSCSLAGDTGPVVAYGHSGGNCSITGGFVYRGPVYPKMAGQYVYADFCSGRIWTLPANGTQSQVVQRANTSAMITSFGESERGELFAVTIDGKLYRVYTS